MAVPVLAEGCGGEHGQAAEEEAEHEQALQLREGPLSVDHGISLDPMFSFKSTTPRCNNSQLDYRR